MSDKPTDTRFFTSGRIVPMSEKEVKEYMARKKQMKDDDK
jgi:hypothetical protein